MVGVAPFKPISFHLNEFDDAGWDPFSESRAHYESRIRATVERNLRIRFEGYKHGDTMVQGYFEEVNAQLDELNQKHLIARVPTRRQKEHFAWLVRFQVKGERPADIWRSIPRGDKRKRQAVYKAIRGLAADLDLKLRRE
jgi:hypothetical protein